MTRRKARPKPDKSIAEQGSVHPKLLVVQKKLVTNVTTEEELEMSKEEMMGHLFKQERRITAQQDRDGKADDWWASKNKET